ncbi:MAG: M16 family metallopeptidase [Flavisolibacter sp.]
MRKVSLLAAAVFAVLHLFAQSSNNTKTTYPEINIPYKAFTLDNGLKLIVHEDHKAPIVAVNIWYHVGSKNEKPGKTGFAHLFEHLMFNGSENYNNDYFKVMEAIGATDLNGTTNEDRTNYFQNIPVSALDRVLWLESDRMGHLLGVIDTPRLNEQRGVVQNEKRMGENQPYAVAWELTTKNTYPAGHPYSWTVIGSMEDLDAASLDDVKDWFRTYYGPNNAVLVIAGDINAETVFQKVKQYFGDIPPGPPVAKHEKWIAKMTENKRQVAQDRVAQSRLQKTWNVPQFGTEESAYLQLLSNILANGKSSRLYKRLVYDDQVASNVSAFLDAREISSQFYITADAKPDVPLSKIESIINEEMKKLFIDGVSTTELERAKTQYFSTMLKGLERIGGFGGKSDLLAHNAVYGGSPDFYKTINGWISEAKPGDIRKVASDWLANGEYVLEIHPFPTLQAAAPTIDRKKMPELTTAPAVKFPETKKFSLSNGLNVVLVPRTSLPVVNMQLIMDGGYSSDPKGKAGLSTMALKMIREGTTTKNSLEISNELADLGASLNAGADLDNNFISVSALKTNLDKTLDLFTDVLLHPSFPQKDFERIKKEQLLQIQQEQTQPFSMAFRVLPQLIYGADHAYSNPITGSGTQESVSQLSRNDLLNYQNTWFSPTGATLVVVGDVTEAEIRSKLESKLNGWAAKSLPAKNISNVTVPEKPVVFIMDKPDAIQSVIVAGQVAPSASAQNWLDIDMMNKILGGEFTSRINMNLREDKHWSYGSGSFIGAAKGPSLFLGYAPVQSDKTKESIVELRKELTDVTGTRPLTEEEFAKSKQDAVMKLPGQWETNSAVIGALAEQIRYNRGDNYWNSYAEHVRNLTVSQLNDAAKGMLKPGKMVWLIIGDRKKIEQDIRDLKIGEVKIIDPSGKVLSNAL